MEKNYSPRYHRLTRYRRLTLKPEKFEGNNSTVFMDAGKQFGIGRYKKYCR